MPKNVIIMGAAGRDFHDFNVYFRDNHDWNVVAFTAEQIPGIEGRKYPPELSGKLYPDGIPIHPEKELTELIKEHDIDYVFLSYSDLSHENVMHKASLVMANGANFALLGPEATQIKSKKPVVSVCAVRTGCGKSQTSRKVAEWFREQGYKVVAIRHPMPYGDLAAQACQRFGSYEDMKKHKCTIEEMEEYEPHIMKGIIVYAGVDYGMILEEAEKEADVIIWDGGNNDTSFYKSDLHIVVADPHRPGHELSYYPGETNFRMADVIIVNKVDSADPNNVEAVKRNIEKVNPSAIVITAESPTTVENPELVRGKRVLVVEDGPTLTHGGMQYGAGIVAAERTGAAEIIDPRPHAVGSIKTTYEKYPHMERILPAMGYSDKQVKELEETIKKTECDAVVIGTPIDLGKIINIDKPHTRVTYELKEVSMPLSDILSKVEVK